MPYTINGDTELKIPLRSLIAVIVTVVTAALYILDTQEKIHLLELDIRRVEERITRIQTGPNLDIELIKHQLEGIKNGK